MPSPLRSEVTTALHLFTTYLSALHLPALHLFTTYLSALHPFRSPPNPSSLA